VPGRNFRQFVRPGDRIGNIDGVGTGLQGWQDVGLHRISGHDRAFGPWPIAAEDFAVGVGGLLADDLHAAEKIAKARGRQLLLLMQQVALGDQHQPVFVGKLRKRRLHTRQGLDRMDQHLAPGGEDFSNNTGRYSPVRQLHGAVDHTKCKALRTVAVEPQIAAFHVSQPGHDLDLITKLSQQFDEPSLGQSEDGLIVPKRVIGIDADRGDCSHERSLADCVALGDWPWLLGPR